MSALTTPDALMDALDALAEILPGADPGGALGAVLKARMGQIARGFTPEHDARLPDCFLENQLTSYLHHAQLARRSSPDQKLALRRARSAYVHVAALALALIDRVDSITTEGEGHV